MRKRLIPLTGLAAAGALLLAACGSSDDAPTSQIFEAPTWNGPERVTYDLLYEGGDLYGYCTLETEPDGDTTTVRRMCTDPDGEGHRDDGMAVIDSETLRPLESQRVVTRADEHTETTFSGSYDEDSAYLTFEQVNLDTHQVEDAFDTDRELPEPTEESPEPGYYDDESLFWLVRGIPLEEGFEGAYHNINLGIARIVVAEVTVEEQETIEVPAGEYDTWRVRLQTASVTQRLWVDTEEPHRVIQAEIEDLTYALRSYD